MMIQLIPAYGRTYKTAADMLQAWKDEYDFMIWNGPYCSIRDVELMKNEHGVTHLVLTHRHLNHTIEL